MQNSTWKAAVGTWRRPCTPSTNRCTKEVDARRRPWTRRNDKQTQWRQRAEAVRLDPGTGRRTRGTCEVSPISADKDRAKTTNRWNGSPAAKRGACETWKERGVNQAGSNATVADRYDVSRQRYDGARSEQEEGPLRADRQACDGTNGQRSDTT